MTNTVVVKAQNPDRKMTALLVHRSVKIALKADEYFLIVIPSNQQVKEAIADRNIDESSAFIAAWADKVQLRWRGNGTLLIARQSG
jgi:hypothetical protein